MRSPDIAKAAADLVLMGAFGASLLFKLLDYRNFVLHVASYRLLSRSAVPAAVPLLLAAELAIAAGLIGNVPYAPSAGALLCLVGFSVFLVYKRKVVANGAGSCACFGSARLLNRYPLSRNAVLIALALVGLAEPVRVAPGTIFFAIVLMIQLCVILLAGSIGNWRRARDYSEALKRISMQRNYP